jgi:SAM-dependent methyltransferase
MIQPILSGDCSEYDLRDAGNDKAAPMGLADVLSVLASPDSGVSLKLAREAVALVAEGESFPFLMGLPLMYPRRAHPYVGPSGLDLPFQRYDDPLLQYLLISSIKQNHGFPNTEHSNVWYRRHIHRARLLLRDCCGIALDVGCEDPDTSRCLFPREVRYIGLDPLPSGGGPFRLLGMAEFLPIRDRSVDAVAFLTSLDHVLDYHRAIDEAWRVLKPGGSIYVAALLWRERADLLGDHYHFHHFRAYELNGVLARFQTVYEQHYAWKDDAHRHGVYLRAVKPE